jgi:integrase/recombinase XerD
VASCERPTFTQAVPSGAAVRTEGGVRYACWTDRRGRAVRAVILPSGKCRRTVPGRWVGVYRDHRGVKRKTPTFGDRSVALRAALEAERAAAAVREGRAAPSRPAGKAHLVDHVDDYLTHLGAAGVAPSTRGEAASLLARALPGCGLTTAAAVDCGAVDAWLERERKARGAKDRPLSLRTRNWWAKRLKAFGSWLERTGRADRNPFARLTLANDATDPRRRRRPLTADEFARLRAAARAGPTRQGLTGPARALLYAAAAYTGLRVGELAALRPESLVWAGGVPVTLTAAAGSAKNRTEATLPVHPALAAELAPWLAARPPGSPVWPWGAARKRRGAKLLRGDLAAAGVPYRDAAGRVADFHALRTTFITNLAVGGVPLVAAQRLARHSDPKLTANVYTRFGPAELAAEVAKLPPLGTPLGSEVGRGRNRAVPTEAGVKKKGTRKPHGNG